MRTVWVARAAVLGRVALLLTVLAVPFAFAQAAESPTPEQLEAFRNLSPEQQKAVLDAMSEPGGPTIEESQPQAQDLPAQQNVRRAQPERPQEPVGPVRIEPGSTLILLANLRDPDAPQDERRALLTQRLQRIAAGNPYRVDTQGRVALSFMPPIAVAGLTDAQATQRLNSDPQLAGIQFKVQILPIEPAGAEALKPFGYDLFGEEAAGFEPPRDIPVPVDYVLGPGDNVSVDLFGKRSARYRLTVGRDGTLTIPDLGPIQVASLTFDQMRSDIDTRVAEQMIGVRASVTMGQLRSIRVFVVGDVVRPGSYTVSGLSTITSALFASGGVSKIGSLRNIELKRRGSTVTRLDLYDLLLRGDTSHDLQLQQGDAIHAAPVGFTAGISGEVRRPALYEFRNGATVGELLELAGGLNPEADPSAAKLERISEQHERVVLNLDLSGQADRGRTLRTGDIVTVPKVLDELAGGVRLDGEVTRPGPYAWHQGLRLTGLLGSLDALKANADQRYVLIRREHMPDRRVEVLSVDALAAFTARETALDPALMPRDRVLVFSRDRDRGTVLRQLLEDMKLQSRDNQPTPIISVYGRVRAPGEYPFESGMTVGDMVRAGGGLDEAAFRMTAELTRYEVVDNKSRTTEVIEIDLARVLNGDAAADLTIRPYDVLVIKEVPEWSEQESMTILGQVRFPGRYPIRKGETLSSVVERAGGLTDAAFPQGSVFMREELKAQEREQVDVLVHRLQSDLALLALQSSQTSNNDASDTLATGQQLLAQLREAEPKGRLVINLERAVHAEGSEDDLQLRNNDILAIPRLRQYVTVIGEVQNATSHVWKSGLSRDEYIRLSGGTSQRADTKRIYIVRANGSVVARKGDSWFGGGDPGLEPGDTIVVPIDAERMRPLALWTAVTTIIYNIGVAVAAIGSL
jgi:polysaccharide biosynthesis/export protein